MQCTNEKICQDNEELRNQNEMERIQLFYLIYFGPKFLAYSEYDIQEAILGSKYSANLDS